MKRYLKYWNPVLGVRTLPAAFMKIDEEEFKTYIENCPSFLQENFPDGAVYKRQSGEIIAVKTDLEGCYTATQYWRIFNDVAEQELLATHIAKGETNENND